VIGSREQVALAGAVLAAEAIAKWLAAPEHLPKRWYYLFDGVPHAADALEVSWKVQSKVSTRRKVSFPQAGELVGLASRARPKADPRFIPSDLQASHRARNARHKSFNDAIDRAHVLQNLGRLFLTIQLATGERLERYVEPALWDVIRRTPDAAKSIEDAASNFAYLRCESCSYHLFDFATDACRLCFHEESTFSCADHRGPAFTKASISAVSDWTTWTIATICRPCFTKRVTRLLKRVAVTLPH
jgi:hypothetical protein